MLHLGQLNIIGNISLDMNLFTFEKMAVEVVDAFRNTDLGSVIGLMQTYFGSEKFTVWNLFKDEKRKIIHEITEKTLRQVETDFREIYNDNYQLMTLVAQSGIPVPAAYIDAVQFLINHDLEQFFTNGNFSRRELSRLLSELKKWNVALTNEASLKLVASERVFEELKKLHPKEVSARALDNLNNVLESIEQLGIQLDFWKSQNQYFSLSNHFKNGERALVTQDWDAGFQRLGKLLKVRGNVTSL